MVLGSEYLGPSLRIATVVVPVAIYFLVLGLLNSRQHPQLLSGRRDFALMIASLCPLFMVPALEFAGCSPLALAAVAAVLGGAIAVLAPRGANWVIYNLPSSQAKTAVAQTLQAMGLEFSRCEGGFDLARQGAFVHLSGFSLLRNVSIRLGGGGEDLARRFEAELSRTLSGLSAETSPMAVALLLVATAMLVAPLTLVAHRVPEIVRILTDLLP